MVLVWILFTTAQKLIVSRPHEVNWRALYNQLNSFFSFAKQAESLV